MSSGLDRNPSETMDVLGEIAEERTRQKSWGADDFDKSNSRNDWIAYITSYAGDAAAKVRKKELLSDEEEARRFRQNMLKVATLAIAAVEAQDKGYC